MGTMVFHSQLYHHHNFKVNTIQHIKLWFKLAIRRFLSVHRSCTTQGCDALPRVEMDRPTKRGGEGGGKGGEAGDSSPGPPIFFREQGPHVTFNFFFFFLGCIFTLFLFLLLSIALYGLNE